MRHEDYSEVIYCETWKDLKDEYDKLHNGGGLWIFRGQKYEKWNLKTTLERLTDLDIVKPKKFLSFEFGLLRKFERELHLHSQRTPVPGDLIEWFSLMQHHGTPTRLLDWTYSYYVATYFALEDIEYDKDRDSAVWAINFQWLEKKLDSHYGKAFAKGDRNLRTRNNLKKILNTPGVIRVNPYFVHERLSVQQGCFLFPGDTTKSFVSNLLDYAGSKKELKRNLYKFIISRKELLQKEILEELFRMNITRTTLFSGIDGYASSLKVMSFILPETLKPGEEYEIFVKKRRT